MTTTTKIAGEAMTDAENDERCAGQFRKWTNEIRAMLLAAGEKSAAARVDGYSFETFKAGYESALSTAPAQSCGDAEQADAVQVDTPGKLILNGDLVNVGIDESGIGDMELIVGTRGVLLSGLSIDETKALAPLLFQAVKLIVARASSTGDQA